MTDTRPVPRCPRRPLVAALLAAAGAAGAEAQTGLFTLGSEAYADWFGGVVSRTGDVDGDGCADFAVSARWHDQAGFNAGRVRLYSGKTGGVLLEWTGAEPAEELGFALAIAGDVDGDGVFDLVAGAPRATAAGAAPGRAVVLSGKNGSPLHVFWGDADQDAFGSAVAGAGDVDGDGFADLLVGAPEHDGGGNRSGQLRVHSGATGAVLRTIVGDASEALGNAVSGVGDLDLDGADDLVAGAWGHALSTGAARVYSGSGGGVIHAYTGDVMDDHFGVSVQGVGDLNGDGALDFAVGAWAHDLAGPQSGQARAYSGLDGSTLHTTYGTGEHDRYGISVGRAGDVDGDGHADLVVGAAQVELLEATGPGYARVLSGPTGDVLFELVGPDPDGLFGASAAGIGDANGDGFADLGIGAPTGSAGAAGAGSASVFSGVPMALAAAPHVLSVGEGGAQLLTLDAGPAHAGSFYYTLGSGVGTDPPFVLEGVDIPLVPDLYFAITVQHPAATALQAPFGLLDAQGAAAVPLVIPPGSNPAVAGKTFYHAVVLIDGSGQVHGTGAVPVTLLP